MVKAFPWVLNLGALGAWDLAILFSRTLRRALLDSYGGGVHNIRALNISRGNPSLTDSVRLELLLIFDPHTKNKWTRGCKCEEPLQPIQAIRKWVGEGDWPGKVLESSFWMSCVPAARVF